MHKKASAAQASPNSSIKIAFYRASVLVLACLPSGLAAQQTAYSYNSPGDLTTIDDPAIIDEIRGVLAKLGYPRKA